MNFALIQSLSDAREALRAALPFVEQAADANEDGAVQALMLVEHALEDEE